MDFYLTSKSLKQIKESGIENDFEIRIFDETIYCSKFVASFISQKISRIMRNDPTISNITLDFSKNPVLYSSIEDLKKDMKEDDFFTKFQKFVEGEPIHIEKSNTQMNNTISTTAKLLFEIGQILENDEMIDSSFSQLYENKTNEIDEKNFLDKLKIYRHCNSKMSDKVIEFISTHFCEIFQNDESKEKAKKSLSKEELERIFSSDKLKIESEDWLFELICSLGPEFYSLFDYIEIQYLSVEKVKQLIEIIDNEEINIHNLLWSSICRRLLIDPYINNEMKNPRVKNVDIQCEQGIFKYLSEINNVSNIYSSKIIGVKSSQINDGQIENLFDHSKSTYFRVRNDDGNGYIIFDFQQQKVNIDKYYVSVITDNGTTNGRPKTWRIEGSNDEQKWEEIDSKENDTSLNDYGKSNTFKCKNINNQFYQFIRFKPIKDHDGTNLLLLSEIEFYGSIKK